MKRVTDLSQRVYDDVAAINGLLDRVRVLRLVELGDLSPVLAESADNVQVPGSSCLAELIDQDSTRTFFKRLREHGFRQAGEILGTDEQTLRKELWSFVQSKLAADEGISLSWTTDGVGAAHQIPEEISRISDLLHIYACECFLFVEQSHTTRHQEANSEKSVHPNIAHVVDLTDAYLAQVMICVATAVQPAEDTAETRHREVHITEVVSTFCGTVILLLEQILNSSQEPGSDTPAPMHTFALHPVAGGLIEMADQFAGTEVSGPRPVHRQKMDIDRAGVGISFDELANVYRVSPISVSKLLDRVTARIKAKILSSEADREIVSSLDAKMLTEAMGQALETLQAERAKPHPLP